MSSQGDAATALSSLLAPSFANEPWLMAKPSRKTEATMNST